MNISVVVIGRYIPLSYRGKHVMSTTLIIIIMSNKSYLFFLSIYIYVYPSTYSNTSISILFFLSITSFCVSIYPSIYLSIYHIYLLIPISVLFLIFSKFVGIKFITLSEYLYKQKGIVLFALQIKDLLHDKSDVKIYLNPADFVIPSLDRYKTNAFVIAR